MSDHHTGGACVAHVPYTSNQIVNAVVNGFETVTGTSSIARHAVAEGRPRIHSG